MLALSRMTLVTSDPTTYSPVFDLLMRSASLLEKNSASCDSSTHANLLRCISTAFHNIASTLCQASRFDFAVRFLNQTCALGERALVMYRATPRQDGTETDEKMAELWVQAEDQLYRRWEILAICHMKTGDRKVIHRLESEVRDTDSILQLAFQCFVNAVKSFPFHRHAHTEGADRRSGIQLAWGSPSLKRVGDIIDRLTYAGLCDLFLDPTEVSLRSALEDMFVGDLRLDPAISRRTIAGAVLERQVDSLINSVWKPRVRAAMIVFLQDLLTLYDATEMPLRRARVLLKQLELIYHDNNSISGVGVGVGAMDPHNQTAEEAETLLSVEVC